MKLALPNSPTSVIFHIFMQDATSVTGAGKTGIAYGSFTVYYVRAGGTLTQLTPQDISTLGTYAAPTANTNIRIKEVHTTNAPGLYEVQVHNDNVATGANQITYRFAASGCPDTWAEIQLADTCSASAKIGTPTDLGNGIVTIAGNLQDLDTEMDLVKTKTDYLPSATAGATGGVAIVGSRMDLKDAPNSTATAAFATALLDLADGIETGFTPRQALRVIGAVTAGKNVTAQANYFYSLNGSYVRVVGTVAAGVRTGVTYSV